MINRLNTFDLKDKRVLMRVDFNVPIENGVVADDYRIRATLPTIEHCFDQGASVVLMSHLGRPKGKAVDSMSLIPVGEKLADLLEMPIKFSEDCVSEDAQDTSLGISPSEIHLLENLRFHSEETENDPRFSMKLAKHGQVFINDAFGTAHRSHSSNVGIVEHFKQKGIGFLMENEMRYLHESFRHPKRPLTIILGGAKVDTKLSLIHQFMDKADNIIIGGGMAFTFLKAKGKNVGESLVDESMIPKAEQILNDEKNRKATLVLPKDFICGRSVDDSPEGEFRRNEFPDKLMGLDIGSRSIETFIEIINNSGTILWNGPMGVFENEEYSHGSKSIAESMVNATTKEKVTVVGGGDTAAAIRGFGLHKDVSHVSTGGGASLELLSGEKLPAFSALDSK